MIMRASWDCGATAAVHVDIRIPAAACREPERDRGDGQVASLDALMIL